MIKNFRDVLALLLGVIVFPGIWIGQGLGYLVLPGEVLGVTIVLETLIGQFFFRKAQAKESQTNGTSPTVKPQ